MANPTTNPENMLPIMIVLGIMFLGICIAMNLFSRARFKKRSNAFAVAARATPPPPMRKTHRGSGVPGSCQKLETQVTSRGVSPMPGVYQVSTTTVAKQYQVPCTTNTQINSSAYPNREHRVSIVKN